MTKPTDKWNRCPNCNSTDIVGDHMEVDGTEAWCEVTCYSCDTRWTEIYTATYRTNIQYTVKPEERT